MPKLRQTEEQRRRIALAGAIARGAAYSGLNHDFEVAEAIGINRSSYCKYKAKSFQNADFSLFCRMARRLGMTGEEVCKIIGVPFNGEN